MIKTIAALGLVGAAGISICDLCPPGSQRIAAVSGRVSITPLTIALAQSEKKVTLNVEGMTCGGCVLGTRKVLTRLSGVLRADVSYENHRAVVTYDPAKVTVEQMIAAIKTLGYRAQVIAS